MTDPVNQPPPLPETDSFPPLDEHAFRRKSRHHPNVPERLPEYRVQPNPQELRALGLFDAHGRPIVASAREITPNEDNPFSPWMKLGMRIVNETIQANKIWPLNIGNNPLLFYYVGRKVRFLLTDLLIPLLMLLQLAVYFWGDALLGIVFPGAGWVWSVMVIFLIPGLAAIIVYALVRIVTQRLLKHHVTEVFLNDLRLTQLTRAQLTHAVLVRVLAPLGLWLGGLLVLAGIGWVGVVLIITMAASGSLLDSDWSSHLIYAAFLLPPWAVIAGVAALLGSIGAFYGWFTTEELREEALGEQTAPRSLEGWERPKVVMLFLGSATLFVGGLMLVGTSLPLLAIILIYSGYKGLSQLYVELLKELGAFNRV
ncbi:MAG: hypothetical protein SFY68_02370 [Candidatus Sumerlaeia bacterium]|nr:hypothetical protein [Candidatus Sumerlaeia bacterium]